MKPFPQAPKSSSQSNSRSASMSPSRSRSASLPHLHNALAGVVLVASRSRPPQMLLKHPASRGCTASLYRPKSPPLKILHIPLRFSLVKTVILTSLPAQGTAVVSVNLSINAITYTPDENFAGGLSTLRGSHRYHSGADHCSSHVNYCCCCVSSSDSPVHRYFEVQLNRQNCVELQGSC